MFITLGFKSEKNKEKNFIIQFKTFGIFSLNY